MSYFDFHHHKINVTEGIYNVDLQNSIPETLYSIGIHPKDIKPEELSSQFEWLQENIHQNCFAIGECGLDGFVDVNEKLQSQVFLKQIILANEIQKPIIIHCVRRFSELIPFRKKSKTAMIVHGFNKKQQIAKQLLENNFHLSFGKAVLYNLSLQNTLKDTPLDKLFLETDNADFDISELYQKAAEIKKISLENLQEQIFINLETIKNG